ncbi:hypothetical protein DPPLL_37720 [Desulfofustis limnaeus]|uniref:Uncharacterized protein n=1 Tax=Desulfofustis limnaeus TaxID=2740163 RepID=A0ABM7WEI4_9BACT|nr:hypothetical protein DPPLL_37720 [Desulfofustis limnaeus]
MKLICPNCGLGGTAETEFYEKKVRCPRCRQIFQVTSTVVVGLAQGGIEVIKQSLDAHDENGEEIVTYRSSHRTDEQGRSDLMPSVATACSRCGFVLSGAFIKVIDDRPVCLACAG